MVLYCIDTFIRVSVFSLFCILESKFSYIEDILPHNFYNIIFCYNFFIVYIVIFFVRVFCCRKLQYGNWNLKYDVLG